jgi:hypothetical protein
MGIPSSGTIKMGGAGTNSIAQVKAGTDTGTPSAVQNVSLRGLSVDGVTDFQYTGGANTDIPVAGSTPNQTAPFAMSEFHGYVQTLATRYYASLSQGEFASDSNIIVRPQLRIMYLSGNINVYWYGGAANTSPSSGSLVYQITNPAAGYTVRDSHTATGDGPDNWTYSNIQPNGSAVSIPTSTFYQDWQPTFESGGSYDDAGTNTTTLSGNLIFEKSGETTFTYSFTLNIEIETEGSGGE